MTLSEFQSLILPVGAAVLAGGLIGLEREWRGRAAGFRTHILVSLASCLLMLAAMTQADWAFEALPNENIVTDPTRMAHGVLTGIGFLCAGVIFRTGFSIHGLTTAASLWITSAIGLLFGAGLYALGVVGTVTTAAILIGLRLVNRRLPQRTLVDVQVCWRREGPTPEAGIVAALHALAAATKDDRFELLDGGASVRRSWLVETRGEASLQTLAQTLTALPGVTGFTLDPRAD